MVNATRRWSFIALSAMLVLAVGPAAAQPPPTPYNLGGAPGAQAGFYAPPYYPPGWGGYYNTGVGSMLSGTADVINSQGQWLNQVQQAGQAKEQQKQMMVDTKRKKYDEWLYERNTQPTFQDDRNRFLSEDLRRALNDPPLSEIWSGLALNTILSGIQRTPVPPGQQPNVPIDPNMLQFINVTSGASKPSIGLLRNDGRLQWPLALQDTAYDAGRQQLNMLAPQALKQAQSGQVEGSTLRAMIKANNDLINELKSNIANMTADDYIRAKRFLGEISNTITALQSPNVAAYASHRWSAAVTSVAQLVTEMTRQGLFFAPATQGDEGAYVAMQRALATFDTEVRNMLGLATNTRYLKSEGPPPGQGPPPGR
jgi:hypothetical protein